MVGNSADIRTKRNRLVGRVDGKTGTFSIKDGGKLTRIEIPAQGLRIWHTSSDGVTEEVCIPAPKRSAVT
jgi:hypothetical protein